MATLYVIEPGARLEKEYQRLLVVKDDEALFRVPVQHLSQVVLVGRTGVTTPAMQHLLYHEVPLLFVSRTGKLLGKLLPPTAANLPLRQAQYRRNDDQKFSLAFSRARVAGKIHNQRVFALRLARRKRSPADERNLADMQQAVQKTHEAADISSLMGIEGQAARKYFQLFRNAFGENWAFIRRNRRPPKDPINALLSLGYTFLGHAVESALETVGLDPYLGYFHAEAYGRPALALDMVEEFRAPIVDSLVLTLVKRGTLMPDDFQHTDKGVYLTTPGLRTFLCKFSQRLDRKITSRELGRRISYRKLLEVQARKLVRVIQAEDDAYEPFRAR